jgi:hypothetical protein
VYRKGACIGMLSEITEESFSSESSAAVSMGTLSRSQQREILAHRDYERMFSLPVTGEAVSSSQPERFLFWMLCAV